MEDEIERLVIGVRADTAGFARDVAAMKAGLEQGVGAGAERAGRSIERSLARAVASGKLGFDDLKGVALKVMEEIATSAIKAGIGAATGGAGGLAGLASALIAGLPGRATGGPVNAGVPYLVGERGPELFVPGASGAVRPISGGGSREVRVSINVAAPAGSAPEALARSGRQVARAVAQALQQAEG